jgi:hypothetical protein
VHESADELRDLQALLDTSIGAAGPHLRSIFGESTRVPADRLVELLSGMQVIDLATVTAHGEPRVGPVDGHFLHGRWHFGSSPDSFRARHLAARPAVSAAHTRGEELCVVTHGYAEHIDLRSDAAAPLVAHLRTVYPDFDEWASLDSLYWVLDPTRMFARLARE